MKQIKIGSVVEWSQQKLKATGKLVGYDGGLALVTANGSTHEVDPALLKAIKTCPHCGKSLAHLLPCEQIRQQFCSPSCSHESQKSDSDQWIFDTIIEYKRMNDGNSPTLSWITERSGLHESTAKRAIRRLVQRGQLITVGKTKDRAYIIPGARWVYEPEATNE